MGGRLPPDRLIHKLGSPNSRRCQYQGSSPILILFKLASTGRTVSPPQLKFDPDTNPTISPLPAGHAFAVNGGWEGALIFGHWN